MAETTRVAISGIAIEVPTEPPSPDECPVQSRIECSDGLWAIDVWKGGKCLISHGPESFVTALYRAMAKEDLGADSPDQIVLRWIP